MYIDDDLPQEQPENGQVKRQEIASFAMAFAMAQCRKGMCRDTGRGRRPRIIPPLPVYSDSSASEREMMAAFNRLEELAARWQYGVPVDRIRPRRSKGYPHTMKVPFSNEFPDYKYLQSLNADHRYRFKPEVWAAAMIWDSRNGHPRWSIRRDSDLNVLIWYDIRT